MRRLRTVLLAGLLLVSAGFVLDGEVRLAYMNVESERGSVMVSWETSVERGVDQFVLMRRTSYSADFVEMETFEAQGAGQVYLYRDGTLYSMAKQGADDEVAYRLEWIGTDGVRHSDLPVRMLSYQPTAVRRTWGSIKAMFQ